MKKLNHRLTKGHGGKRTGAGRPIGTGKYKLPTKTIRVPVTIQDKLIEFIDSKCYSVPYYSNFIQAGIPIDIGDGIFEEVINLYELLVRNPKDTYLVRATGESMKEIGINTGDLLIVDKKIVPKSGSIVVACINSEFTVKRLVYKKEKIFLKPENKKFKTINVEESDRLEFFGVVTHNIKRL